MCIKKGIRAEQPRVLGGSWGKREKGRVWGRKVVERALGYRFLVRRLGAIVFIAILANRVSRISSPCI